MSQGIGIYTLVQPCCTSRLLWRRGRVSDCHPGDPGSIPVRVRSEDIFLHLSHTDKPLSSCFKFGVRSKYVLLHQDSTFKNIGVRNRYFMIGFTHTVGNFAVTGHFILRSFRIQVISYQFGHFVPTFWSFRTQ